jgi:hypothetical protein
VAERVGPGRPNACNLCHLDKSLAWTADQLNAWVKRESPALTKEQKETPAGLLWALKGDAGQRALAVWHFGWKPAQDASGTNWAAIVLAPLLNDSYAAVRYMTARAIKTMPGFSDFKFDFVAAEATRKKVADEVSSRAEKLSTNRPGVDRALIPVLLKEQNQRAVHLRE